MDAILVRNIPKGLKMQIEKEAQDQHISLSQAVIRMLQELAADRQRKAQIQKSHSEAVRRLKEIREEIYRRHGLSNDAVRMIREDRNR